MELILKTDLSVIPQSIEFNFDEIKSELEKRLEYYNNLIVTAESMKDAKTDRANLNKLKTAVEDKRKEIKKMCLEPYTAFENKCKELCSMIAVPISAIDNQIKAFAEIEKQKKLDELKAHYEIICTDKMITFEDVLPEKWGNKSESAESLKNQMNMLYDRYAADINSIAEISGGNNERHSALLAVYLRNKNMNEVIAENSKLNRIAEKISVNNTNEETKPAVDKRSEIADNEPIQNIEPTEHEPILEASFKIRGTKSQIIAIRDFMINNGIEFMPV